jgi:hypothetical protein
MPVASKAKRTNSALEAESDVDVTSQSLQPNRKKTKRAGRLPEEDSDAELGEYPVFGH